MDGMRHSTDVQDQQSRQLANLLLSPYLLRYSRGRVFILPYRPSPLQLTSSHNVLMTALGTGHQSFC